MHPRQQPVSDTHSSCTYDRYMQLLQFRLAAFTDNDTVELVGGDM